MRCVVPRTVPVQPGSFLHISFGGDVLRCLRRLPFPPLVQRLALLRRWSRRQFGPRPRPHVALSSLLPNLLLPPLPLLRFSRTGGRSLPLSLLFQLRTQPLRLTLLRLRVNKGAGSGTWRLIISGRRQQLMVEMGRRLQWCVVPWR